MYRDYKAQSIGAAKVVAEVALSDGSTAYEILNFWLTEDGALDSTLRIMPLIPEQWAGGAFPEPFYLQGCVGIGAWLMGDDIPEMLFFGDTSDTESCLYRFTPWTRAGAAGSSPVYMVDRDDSGSLRLITHSGSRMYPVSAAQVGNRVYFTFGDGTGAWVWDRREARPLGYSTRPEPPSASGPSRDDADHNNDAGFSIRGRVGTTEGDWTREDAGVTKTVGGIDDFERRYAIVWENCDGAYSRMSDSGGPVYIYRQTADPHNALTFGNSYADALLRRFWLKNISRGPLGTRARILLATPNLKRLSPGDDGSLRFCHRIPNNEAIEWIDDIPDGELGAVWEDREDMPIGAHFIQAFAGSLWFLRTYDHPSRAWWSEQTTYGPVPESVLRGHWMDVYPHTGPITGGFAWRQDRDSAMFVFKEAAIHVIFGQYPEWERGTIDERKGLAGPRLVQACPDGSVIGYGAGTFWKIDPDGKIEDIGLSIRRTLKKVNTTRARMGVSWIDRRAGEVVFALPMNDSSYNNREFAWDYRLQGWRFHEVFESIVDACVLPGSDLVVIVGTLEGKHGAWVYGRGYPAYTVTPVMWRYQSGWCSFEADDPNVVNAPHNVRDFILTAEERGKGEFEVKTYKDWNLDEPTATGEYLHGAHPDDHDLAYYADGTAPADEDAEYDVDLWRTRRVFTERIPTDAASHKVAAFVVAGSDPFAILSVEAFGPQLARPGGRTPQR